MDNLATIGLVDLGNSFLSAGDLNGAESMFRRSLDSARRGKVRSYEARGMLSLASLGELDPRADEGKQFEKAALPFYRQAGYRRELIQARMILGGVHEQLGKYDDGVRVEQR